MGVSGYDRAMLLNKKPTEIIFPTGQIRKRVLRTERVDDIFSTRNILWGNGNIATGQINTKSQPYQAGNGLPNGFTHAGKETRRQK